MSAAVAAGCVSSSSSFSSSFSSSSSSNTTSTSRHHRNSYPSYNQYPSVPFISHPQLYRRSYNDISHTPAVSSRYESQKRHDWNTFSQYLRDQYRTSFLISRCTAVHVLEFLEYLDDQFGDTKFHTRDCPFYGHRHSPPEKPCPCPLRKPWSSLDALVGRLRAAFEEYGGQLAPEMNPFGAPAVRLYLRELREAQDKARGA